MSNDDQLIVDMFTAGVSMRQIAEHFHCTHNKISSLLKTYGYTSDYRKRLDEKKVCEEYLADEDLSATALGKKYKTTGSTIARILKKNNVPIKRKFVKNLELDEDLIVDLYVNDRLTTTEIGKLLGCGCQAINLRLKKHDVLRTSGESNQKWFVNEEYFNKIDTRAKAYWLGFLFADGYVKSNLRDFGLTLASFDRGHIEKFVQAIEYTGPIFDGVSKDSFDGYGERTYSRIVPASRTTCQYLIEHGCVPKKTHVTEAPLGLPDEFIKDFCRGVVDGDGGMYVYENKGSSLEIVGDSGILSWLREQGPSNLTDLQRHKSIWRIRSRADNVVEWVDWLYSDAEDYLDRKYLTALTILEKRR